MLGQQKVKDDAYSSNANAVELFTRFPHLHDCLLKHLLGDSNAANEVRVRPVLFPVLTILSKLNAPKSTEADR